MTRSLLPSDDEMMERRIDASLNEVGRRLTVFQDGIANWDERLPEFRGSPRRWQLDDARATTVGEALLSRYGGYDWWVVQKLMQHNGSLDRAFSRGRMNPEQEDRFRKYQQLLEELSPKAEARGLVSGWPPDPVSVDLIERCVKLAPAEIRTDAQPFDEAEGPSGADLNG